MFVTYSVALTGNMNQPSAHLLEAEFRTQLKDYGLTYDPVTGLPNAVSFRSSLRRMLAEAGKENKGVALLWIDLTNERREYSIGGETASQRVLCTLADALRPAVEDGELICRYGDHTFLLALRHRSDLELRLELILEAAGRRPMRGFDGRPEVASGVAHFPEHARNHDELIRFACLAAGTALRTRSRAAIPFRPAMHEALLLERLIEKDLRLALSENQLSVAYQPQIDLNTGNILGVEVLTRWNHPTRGFVPPAQFIPIAEQSDLIDEIFAWSLRKLLSDAAVWRAQGIVPPRIAINASAANIRHDQFVEVVAHELMRYPLGPTQLEIEVTESLLMDDEDLFQERLHALRSIGVKVSLDDFGTRYTGFNALKGLPLHSMKIDRCFVQGVHRSTQAQSLFRTIVAMANQLELATVAEGIEEMGELCALRKVGCNAGQGYLFQRPAPAAEFLAFLAEWPQRKLSGEFASVFTDVEVDPCYEVDPLFGVVS
ncbi:MAG TPA: GGDEF domain-containing phosphodiesterase [Acidobacteriaceae bacterium]|nr:GGDEF domain-containing phosphodiesterase [Acidobacteriaceae bacterium]